jgi:conjugal transfer pilus assembly protein TraB
VWAGTFATGYLMTGIVGDAGTNSTKNRGTVAIKITGTGTMPNGQYSHLRNCVVLGSTYGDLSSDSDVIHLETLSCAGKKYSFEKKVYGSVFDLDAMQDLRGIPVLKAKPILGYATVAGLIAGIGDGLSSSGQTSSVTGAGVVTTPTSVMKSGLGQGISKPADKITDYLMNIANMYHPIVVAHAGRKVTILFQAGFFIDKAHNSYDSMKSINTTHNHGTQEQSQIKHEPIQTDTLTQNIQKASGNVTEIAQKQASTQFDHRVNLGGGLFEPIQK